MLINWGTPTVHAMPAGEPWLMPCCGRDPLSISPWQRLTDDPEKVTCRG